MVTSGLGRARGQARGGSRVGSHGSPDPLGAVRAVLAGQPSWQQGPLSYPWCPGLDGGTGSPGEALKRAIRSERGGTGPAVSRGHDALSPAQALQSQSPPRLCH